MIARLLKLDAVLSQKLHVAGSPGPLRTAAAFFAHSGDSWFWLAGLLLVWGLGTPAWKTSAQVMLFSILVTGLVVMVMKFTIRRRRPQGEWGEIYRKTDPHSFPSGHAARAAMLVVVGLGAAPLWFGLVLLVWAPLVALARVAMGVHYVLDVLGGVILGIGLGFICLSLFQGIGW